MTSARSYAAGMRSDGTVEQRGLAARRLAVCGLAAVAALAGTLAAGLSWPVATDLAWDAAAVIYLAWVLLAIWARDAETTRRMARAEDVSQPNADLVILSASVASLVAVLFVLSQAGHRHGAEKGLLIALALVSVSLAWLVVHITYAVKYADRYYSPPEGGIDFNSEQAPDYQDIIYLALTIGMTYQVSDTEIQAKKIRRVALRHALLSFLFGALIVAITINIVGSLVGR